MKTITIKGEYIANSDLAFMLEKLLQDVKDGKTSYYRIRTNMGGKLTAEIEEYELEDLRK